MRDQLNLKFSNLNFEGFLDLDLLKVNVDRFFKVLKDHSTNRSVTHVDHLRKAFRQFHDTPRDPWQYSRGHDVVSVLQCGLKYIFGAPHAKKLARLEIESGLRLAFSIENLKQTQLFQSIRVWENLHPPFIVFFNQS